MPRIVGFAGGAALNFEVGEVPPAISTSSLANARVGLAYSRTVVATGTAPITFAVQAGVLPDGLSLDTDTGEISGTPTTEESQTFTIRATNAYGTDDQELTIDVGPELNIVARSGRAVGLGIGLGL